MNSGMQRAIDFTRPDSINLATMDEEFLTNYTSFIHLTTHFLPFLQKQSVPSSLIYTTSGLALSPILRVPGYCASKAAWHHLILVLREQLRSSNVKVRELLPPLVQTELHDAKYQPDIWNGGAMGMPLDEYTEKTWKGLVAGNEDVPVGMSAIPYKEGGYESLRRKEFERMVSRMR